VVGIVPPCPLSNQPINNTPANNNDLAEAEWGADPLSFHGGFQSLTLENTTFPSSLPVNGSATWSTTTLSRIPTPPNSSQGTINVSFNNTNWDILRSTYGWSGIQFQAWARGAIELCEEENVVVYVVGANEFWIDDRQYFGGDMYGYKRAPLVVNLGRGNHKIDIRVTHDIRAFGGGMPPGVGVEVDVRIASGGLVAVEEEAMVPDLVAGRLAGKWVSLPVRNEETEGWIEVLEVSGGDVCVFPVGLAGMDSNIALEFHESFHRRGRSTFEDRAGAVPASEVPC